MGFFDLNIPYTESDKNATDKPARKSIRLKLTVKAMELGYSGVAYNHTIKTGVMSESDRCSISLFPLSSVVKVSPYLSSAVNLHRQLLNVPVSAPFRQYTRLTVVADLPSHVSALNSGNPVLKTYDIVAVRPLNQNTFELACQASEVDLIAIDFSEKLPFRLKQHIIKAAIERGLHFEITYSGLLLDAQVRRQLITNAKLLVDWTRGKNLIFSSSAPSVTELRGPYDVANLLTLLGISMERAKASISETCRSLIANALRRKQFFKGAIRVEVISSTEQVNLKGLNFDDWLKWDPISSGEGDLQFDDMEKFFATSTKKSPTVKAIDFSSIVDGLPLPGLRVQSLIPGTTATTEPHDICRNLSAAGEIDKRLACQVPVESNSLNLPEKDQTLLIYTSEREQALSLDDAKTGDLESFATVEKIGNDNAIIMEDKTLFNEEPEIMQASNLEDGASNGAAITTEDQLLFGGVSEREHTLNLEDTRMSLASDTEEAGNDTVMIMQETKTLFSEEPEIMQASNLEDGASNGTMMTTEDQILFGGGSEREHTLNFEDTRMSLASDAEEAGDDTVMIVQETKGSNDRDVIHTVMEVEENKRFNISDGFISSSGNELQCLKIQVDETSSEPGAMLNEENAGICSVGDNTKTSSASTAVSAAEISTSIEHTQPSALLGEGCKSLSMDKPLSPLVIADEELIKGKGDLSLPLSDTPLHGGFPEGERLREMGDRSIVLADAFPMLEYYDEMQNKCVNAVCINEPSEYVAMKDDTKIDEHTGLHYLPVHEPLPERVRRRQRSSGGSLSFPFKRFLHSSPFKKKPLKLTNKHNRENGR